jgi:PAS domain S-box-containing protein
VRAAREAGRFLLLAAVYYAAARIGLRYATIGQSISLLWPATGVAIAALVLLGPRAWPAVTAGAFLANLHTGVPATAAAGIAAGNTIEALIGAWLLRRRAGERPALHTLPQVRALLTAAPLAALAAALIGVITLRLTGVLQPGGFAGAIGVWWAGDALGALVVAPAILTWALPAPDRHDTRRVLEVAAICVGAALAIEIGLARVTDVSFLQRVDYQYLLFPVVIWAALRFGARGAALMTATTAAVATFIPVRGGGPFVGETRPATVVALSIYLAAVALTGLILAAVITHERNRASEALTRSDRRLALALDAARMGSWYWSVEGDTLSWDEHLRRLYGLGADDVVTGYEQFLARVHPDDRAFVEDSVRHALRNGGQLDYEFRVLVDGETRIIADRGQVVCDADGRPRYVTGVCMDVTDRRRAEERLRQAHRMESVGRLAGGVAHEANNQMSVVLGATHFLLRRNDLPADARADVEQIRNAAERTASVTAQLLAFSRRQVLRPSRVALNDIVRGWDGVLRRVMGEDITIALALDPAAGAVTADAGQLQQVLLNLALNARDAMPRGGHLSIETFAAELGDGYAAMHPGVPIRRGRYAVLAVSDSGHGMPPETLAQVFEPFFTTRPVGQGTGLGLSTVYGIVKQSDGYVWAYSEVDHGTTMKVYLPQTALDAAPAAAAPAPEPPPASGTILVVEDNELVRQLTSRALADAGYRVLEAAGAEAALAILEDRSRTVDIVLTDVVMPGMSGRDLARRGRAIRPTLPVVFTSGYTDREIVRRGLLDPADAFLQKPYTPASLAEFVRARLRANPPA